MLPNHFCKTSGADNPLPPLCLTSRGAGAGLASLTASYTGVRALPASSILPSSIFLFFILHLPLGEGRDKMSMKHGQRDRTFKFTKLAKHLALGSHSIFPAIPMVPKKGGGHP